jgi:biopolymer transport protein ExbD
MRLKARHAAGAVIPTASMADIAFLLIVFFMVTISFEKDKTQVALPKTDLRFEIPKIVAYISVTDQGVIRATAGDEMSTPLDAADVVTFAANVVAIHPGRPIVLKADGDVPYERVDKIIDSLKQAKVELIYLLADAKGVDDPAAGGDASGGGP